MRAKVIVIGQSPSRNGSGGPLEGACGRRLAEAAGISMSTYLSRTTRMNLLDEWPGPSFPQHRAREAAREMYIDLTGGRRVIFLGLQVSAAFGVIMPILEWKRVTFWVERGVVMATPAEPWRSNAVECAIVPHPSGLNRWWNDEANRRAAARFLKVLR